MKRIVCDTNVLLSGLLWRGPPHRILSEVARGDIVIFTSRELLEEISRALDYPKLRAVLCAAGSTRHQALQWIIRHSTLLLCKPFAAPVVQADPSDDNVLACAVAAGADGIVSGDKHLLALVEFDGIPILKPAGFPARIGR